MVDQQQQDWSYPFWYSVNVACDMVGLLMFGALALTTLRQKKLHSSACHVLIGGYALCGMGTKSFTALPFLLYWLPGLAPTLPFFPVCVLAFLLPMTLAVGFFPLMAAVGFDRLLSIFCPIWYAMRKGKFYLIGILSICAIFPLLFVNNLVQSFVAQPTQACLAVSYVIFSRPYLIAYFSFIGITFVCYLLIVSTILWDWRHSEQIGGSSVRQALFKSLALVFLVQIVAYVSIFVCYSLQDSQRLKNNNLATFVDIACSVAMTSEVPILYFTSSDHRMAIRAQFPWLFRLLPKKLTNTVGPKVGVAVTGGAVRSRAHQQQQQPLTAHLP